MMKAMKEMEINFIFRKCNFKDPSEVVQGIVWEE
jgi:hypothetical protein